MAFLKFLYKDDKTGQFSGSTLRTWIAFLSFLFASLFLLFVSFFIQIQDNQIKLIEIIAWVATGTSGFYLGKRVNESIGDNGRKRLEK